MDESDGAARAAGTAPAGGLVMYDLPELDAAQDALWAAIVRAAAARGLTFPADRAVRADPAALAAAPDLALAQVCGLPFALTPPGRLRLVATPLYDAPGTVGAAYRSVLVAPPGTAGLAAAARGPVAVNEAGSQSGHLALRRALALLPGPATGPASDPATGPASDPAGDPAPGPAFATGSHRASLEAVAAGRARLAAIDCVSFALIGDVAPALVARVAVLGVTPAAPGLPLVTAGWRPAGEVAALRAALAEVMADPALAGTRRRLRLAGIDFVPETAYRRLPALAPDRPGPLLRSG